MKRERGDRLRVLQVGRSEGGVLTIPNARLSTTRHGTIAPVRAEEHTSDTIRKGNPLQKFTAGKTADHDLALRGADSQAFALGVPGGRADRARVARKRLLSFP